MGGLLNSVNFLLIRTVETLLLTCDIANQHQTLLQGQDPCYPIQPEIALQIGKRFHPLTSYDVPRQLQPSRSSSECPPVRRHGVGHVWSKPVLWQWSHQLESLEAMCRCIGSPGSRPRNLHLQRKGKK